MRVSHTIFGCALAVSLVGCSIRPLPKNVTRDTTIKIINKIRCETRDALVERIISVLKKPRKDHHEVSAENLRVLQKFEYYGTSEEVMREIRLAELDYETAEKLFRFSASSIVFSFLFTITETKNKDVGGGFTMPFDGGSFGLGLSAKSNKTRKNERTVDVVDTFHSLLTGQDGEKRATGLKCDFVDQPRKHWIYPITGNIGMAEVINTFVDLEKASGTLSTFSDKLTFTTVFDMAAKPGPSVTLDPPKLKHFRLTSANVDFTAERRDVHEVTVTLKIGDPDKPAPEVKDEGYTKIMDLSEKQGFPENSEVGFKIRKTPITKPPKQEGTQTEKPGASLKRGEKQIIKKLGRRAVPFRAPPGRRLFSVSPEALERSRGGALMESIREKGPSRRQFLPSR